MTDLSITLNALVMAAKAHAHHNRKDGSGNYISHPARVAQILSSRGCHDGHVLAAALLHDSIEDTSVTYEQISQELGQDIANTVLEVTNDATVSKLQQKENQITSMATKSTSAKLVKLADTLDNLQSLTQSTPKGWHPERVEGYFMWKWFVVDQPYNTDNAIVTDLKNEIIALIQKYLHINEKCPQKLQYYYDNFVISK